MESPINVRAAATGDAELVVRLIHEAFAEYQGVLDPPSSAHKRTAESIRRDLIEGLGAVATFEGENAGCVLFRCNEDHIYLGPLAVLPAFRNQGVGGALMAFSEQFAKTSDTPRVRLGTRLRLAHVIRFYESRGYKVIEVLTHEGYSQPTGVFLELDLSPRAENATDI